MNNEYIYRVNLVIDYIDANFTQEMSLKKLSRIASFSEFHFHRIFKAIAQETLAQYIQRIRIEKAAFQLLYSNNKSITDIAFDCGFSSSQFFSRVFKERFNLSASEWRRNKSPNSKIVQESELQIIHICEKNIGGDFKMHNNSVIIQDIPDMNVAYLRHIGPYKGNVDLYTKIFSKLIKWAETHKVFNKDTKVLALYNDLPEITDEDKLKLTACLTINKEINPSPPFGRLKIIGGKYAVCRFEILTNDFEKSWNFMYGKWLPQSGYLPDDKPSFELFYNDPNEHPEHKHIVDFCIPVKRIKGGRKS
jgi:AraC family transcriptional regulator